MGSTTLFSFSGGSKTSHGATKPRTAAWVGGGDGYAPGAAGVNRRVTRLTNPLFELFGEAISARDLILLLGGLFLIWKASKEIHESIEGEEEGLKTRVSSFLGAIVQIMLLDIIFSLDSVITAVGLSDHLFIMMAAVVIAVGVMMFAARPIGEFVDRHPSVKMLALSFLIPGWLYPDSGKFRRSRSERLYLFRHVLLYRSREPEPVA